MRIYFVKKNLFSIKYKKINVSKRGGKRQMQRKREWGRGKERKRERKLGTKLSKSVDLLCSLYVRSLSVFHGWHESMSYMMTYNGFIL